MNISGSMMGDEMQNAITSAQGTPDASIPAVTGIAAHEQNGDSAPAGEAATMAAVVFAKHARASHRSAPLAFVQAANEMAGRKKGGNLNGCFSRK